MGGCSHVSGSSVVFEPNLFLCCVGDCFMPSSLWLGSESETERRYRSMLRSFFVAPTLGKLSLLPALQI